jgi:siroheme synthase
VIEGTLEELIGASRRGEVRSPAVIIVGSTVALREKLWTGDAGSY